MMKSLVLLFFALLSSLSRAEVLCYLPGLAGGFHPYITRQVPEELAKRGITFKLYGISGRDDIQAHALRFKAMLEADLARDPDFKCHLIAHSMGGLVARYAVNHLTVHHPYLGEIPLASVILSVTTMATPHQGTPLADTFLGEGWAGARQMSESRIRMWNEPAFRETYSPLVPNLPFYSYRLFLKHGFQSQRFAEFMTYSVIARRLKRQGRDPRNDSVVPLDSQAFGLVLGDINVPHVYPAVPTRHKVSAVDFYVQHFEMVSKGIRCGESLHGLFVDPN